MSFSPLVVRRQDTAQVPQQGGLLERKDVIAPVPTGQDPNEEKRSDVDPISRDVKLKLVQEFHIFFVSSCNLVKSI